MEVVVRDGHRVSNRSEMAPLAARILRAAGCRTAEVTLLFASDREIRSLNRRFRKLDHPTDVLSFPWSSGTRHEGYLGDVAISVPAARRQAAGAGWRLHDELRFLVLHGLLHLLGYDHETDRGEMNELQARLARRILGRDIPPPRIERQPSRRRHLPKGGR